MISLDEMQVFLPSYLTHEGKAELFGQLEKFGETGEWQPYGSGSVYPDKLLQGDGARDLTFVKLPEAKTKVAAGLILSNSCDIDTDNERKVPTQVVYCPLIEGGRYEEWLRKIHPAGAENIIKDSRAQAITNVMYLPSSHAHPGGYYAVLDQVCHMTRTHLPEDFCKNSKIFTLSQVGHYLFLLKLSVHFTRIHEGILRDSAQSA